MNHQHHLKSDPKFGRFSRFSRGGDARGGARGIAKGHAHSDDGSALGQRWPTVVRPSGHGRKAFGATVVRPSGHGRKAFGATVARPSGPRS